MKHKHVRFFGVVVMMLTLSAAAQTKTVLDSPLDWQVIQRNAQEWAEVKVAGTVPTNATLVEAKAELADGLQGKAMDWTVVAKGAQIKDGKFSGSLNLTAGGWYTLKVRFRKSARDKTVLGEAVVEHVGVGEVFITAGQSNSANYGNPRQEAKDDRVVYFDGKGFVHAKDPIPGGCGGGGSPWALLGDRIAASQKVPVCFRSASLTWTEVKNWLPPDTGLYKNLLACVKVFGKDGVRAVLWHQGESDTLVKTSAETYCDRIKTIVETLSKDAGYQIPWFVAQASFHPGSQAPEQEWVAKGQQMLWAKKICNQGPVTDDLLGAEYRHDGVHFNQKGLETHAGRWFDALSQALKWKTSSANKPDAAVGAKDWLGAYDVVWTNQSADARGSMPIGGGNIGLNVWVEKDELLIYIGSPDSWSYRGRGFNTQMQTKLGRLRLKFTPVPWAKEFRQQLELASNSILLSGKTSEGNAVKLRVWVDALQPMLHLEGQADSPVEAAVTVEYPTGLAMAPHNAGQTYGPLVREGRIDGDTLEWWERSPAIDEGRDEYIRRFNLKELADLLPNPMANRTMGGRLSGSGFIADGTGQGTYDGREFRSVKLKTSKPLKAFDLRASLRIAQDTTLEEWQVQVKKLDEAKRKTAKADWKANVAWWQEFWNRSRIVINPGKGPDDQAWQAGRNYQLFRALLASNRTGEFPTLFNGGHFTCEPNPDMRNWFDCQFMAQNQRLVYWPMLKCGDFDLLNVGLEYYRRSTDLQTAWAKHFWKVDGLAFNEGMGIYGADWVPSPEGHGGPAHLTYHKVSGMEFAIMMLDAGSYGGVDVRPYLPIALGYLKYHDQFYRAETKKLTGKELDEKGRLVLFPGNAIEMYQQTRNDACTISGLMALSKALLDLPPKVLSAEQRAFCESFRKTLPPLPVRKRREHQTLAPAESWKSASTWDNIELPELYPVFPFHVYGVGLPGLELARDTWEFSFDHQRQKRNFCWYQSMIYTADLGLADEAGKFALEKFLWPNMRYPAFYDTHGFCQRPDFDHGGSAMVGLQEMLMQIVDKKILLLPAWPKDWDCEFKLHAPYQTVVEGKVVGGKILDLKVTPKSRSKDVVIMNETRQTGKANEKQVGYVVRNNRLQSEQ